MTTTRRIQRVVAGQPASDGAGVRLSRVIGTPQCDHLDPFLLLDEFRSDAADDYIAGFPEHPHRGFETVTYMIHGRMRHKDSTGNSGLLSDGAVQWMTAGRGIVHSEMPEQTDGLLWGYQLWVNLPAALKMSAPRYQDIQSDAIPEVTENGTRVRVVAGTYKGTAGAAETLTEVGYLDVQLEAGATFAHGVPDGHTALAFVYRGTARCADVEVPAGSLAVLETAGHVEFTARDAAGLLLLTGAPLDEPVARYGPFVMNTRDELMQAVQDFQAGRLG